MAIERDFEERHLKAQRKRDIKRHRDSRPLWKKVVVWASRVMLMTVLMFALTAFFIFVTNDQAFELREVQILGSSHLDTGELRRVIRSEFPRNIYRIRLNKVRAYVESQPWVRAVEVMRVAPDKLKILVVERRPVALAKIESELFLVDRQGVILGPYGRQFQHLDFPVVRGLESAAAGSASAVNQQKMDTVHQVLSDLDSGPEKLSDKVSEIDVTDANRVALIPLDQPIRVLVGDSDYRERYQTFLSKLSLMSSLSAKYGPLDSVDLSVKNKIIFHTKNGDDSGIALRDDHTG
ncbi:MAG TPA: FtsQ-type POTRA domain-containing protein [Acidobacteriota bacterium]